MLTKVEELQNENNDLYNKIEKLLKENCTLRDKLFSIRQHCDDTSILRTVVKEKSSKNLNGKESHNISKTDSSPQSYILQNIDYESSPSLKSSRQMSLHDFKIPNNLRHFIHTINKFRNEKRYELAESMCKMHLEDVEALQGTDSSEACALLSILAEIYRDQNKPKEAADLLDRVFKMINNRDNDSKNTEEDNKRRHLANILRYEKRYDTVEKYFSRLQEIYTKIYGRNHPVVQKLSKNLSRSIVYNCPTMN